MTTLALVPNDRTKLAEPHLDSEERRVLQQVIDLGEETRDDIQDKLMEFGREVLRRVFDDDPAAAIDDKRANPLWIALRLRCGGPTFRMSEKMLYVSVRAAAYDRRITSEAWRALDIGRKELLLPLRDDKLLRDGAAHVSSLKLTLRQTEDYVSGVRAKTGKAKETRLTAGRLLARLRNFLSGLTGAIVERQIIAMLRDGDEDERKEVLREIDALRAWADRIQRRLRGT